MRDSSASASVSSSSAGNSSVTRAPSRSPRRKKGRPCTWSQCRWVSRTVPLKGTVAEQLLESAQAGARVEEQRRRRARRRRESGRRTTCFRRKRTKSGPGAGVDPRVPQKVTRTGSVSRARPRGDDPRTAPRDASGRSSSASNMATRHGVTAMLLDVRMPPSRCARSPSSAPGPYSARRSPSRSTRTMPSRMSRTSVPGSPSLTSTVPAGKRSMRRLPPPCISCAESDGLERGLDGGNQRLGVLVAPRAVFAERLAVPVLEVGQARLVREPVVGVVDPVPGEPAGADDACTPSARRRGA